MSQLILPGNSRFATKLREPGLLVPNRKPIGPVEVDWSNPLTRDLRHLFIFQEGIVSDLASHISGVNNGATWRGGELYFSGVNQWVQYNSNDIQLNLLQPHSVLTQVDVESHVNSFDGIVALDLPINDFVLFGSTNSTYGPFSVRTANSLRASVDIDEITDGPTFMGITYNGIGAEAGVTLYYQDLEDTPKNTPAISSITGTQIGRYSSSSEFNGDINFVGIWQRELTADEVRSIRLDRYQLLRPANQAPFIIGVPGVAPPVEGAIKLGTTDINKAYLGSTELTKIYLGDTPVLEP